MVYFSHRTLGKQFWGCPWLYLGKWKHNLIHACVFLCIQSIHSYTTLDDIERPIEKINKTVGKPIINTDKLFDEVVWWAKKIRTSKKGAWETEEKEKDTKLSSEEK